MATVHSVIPNIIFGFFFAAVGEAKSLVRTSWQAAGVQEHKVRPVPGVYLRNLTFSTVYGPLLQEKQETLLTTNDELLKEPTPNGLIEDNVTSFKTGRPVDLFQAFPVSNPSEDHFELVDRHMISSTPSIQGDWIPSDTLRNTPEPLSRERRAIDKARRKFRYREFALQATTEVTSPRLPPPPTSDPQEVIRSSRGRKNKHGRGNRNHKAGRTKGITMATGEDLEKELISVAGSERKGRKKGKARKGQIGLMREGQSARRLRQHMQHKKKVKQFLQKRIQEQIEQRRHRRNLIM